MNAIPYLRIFAALGAVLATVFASTAHAERRIALVIGNSSYQNTPALSNPVNDAQDLAAALTRVGFNVDFQRNLSKQGMEAAIARFSRSAQGADAALFYYAGHGMQYRGSNYLMPTDAKLEDEFNLNFELTRIEDVLFGLEGASGVKILILDSCRNNPLLDRLTRNTKSASRDLMATRGLAKIDPARGMIVAYSTQANQVAVDGTGRNSPFTSALVKYLDEPGLEVGTLFRRVAFDVNKVTEGRQLPEVSVSLLGDFYLNTRDTDVQAWPKVRSSEDAAQLSDFIKQYPKSPLVSDARQRLDTIERQNRARMEREQAERDEKARQQAETDRLNREKADKAQNEKNRFAQEQADREKAKREEFARAEQEKNRLLKIEQDEKARVAREEVEKQKTSAGSAENSTIAMLLPQAETPSAAPAGPQTATLTPPAAAGTTLQGEKAQGSKLLGPTALLIGRTVRWGSDGKATYESDGSYKYVAHTGKASFGRYKTVGSQVCITFPNGKGRCDTITASNGAIILTNQYGMKFQAICDDGHALRLDGKCSGAGDTIKTASRPPPERNVPEPVESKKSFASGSNSECSKMHDKIGCGCALQVGGSVTAQGRWVYSNRNMDAFAKCMVAHGRQ